MNDTTICLYLDGSLQRYFIQLKVQIIVLLLATYLCSNIQAYYSVIFTIK